MRLLTRIRPNALTGVAANDPMLPSLTRREVEVLELVSQGNSAKEVGGLIGIAPRTVERYIENVRLKLGARNRAHMITRAMSVGLLKLPPAQLGEPDLFDGIPPEGDDPSAVLFPRAV